MSSIRNVVFIIISISALVYLVLQSSHGQRWLLQAQQSEHTESEIPQEMAKLEKLRAKTVDNSFSDLFDSSTKVKELSEQIKQLNIQLTDTDNDLAELKQAMQQLVALENKAIKPSQEIKSQATLDNAKKPSLQKDESLLGVHSRSPVEQTVSITKPNKTEARQQQLAQQAKLREVVQRMELTALQAVSR